MGFIVAVRAFLCAEGGISNVIDVDVFFVLQVSGDFGHAIFDISDMVALDAWISGAELFPAGALQPAVEFF